MKLRGTAHPLSDAYRPLSFPGRYADSLQSVQEAYSKLNPMDYSNRESQIPNFEKLPLLDRLIASVERAIIPIFSLFFLAFALQYADSAMFQFWRPVITNGDLVEGLVKGLRMGGWRWQSTNSHRSSIRNTTACACRGNLSFDPRFTRC